MSTMLKTMAAVFMIAIFNVSCTSENEEMVVSDLSAGGEEVMNLSQEDLFRFRYKGQEYCSKFQMNDTTIVYSDPVVATLLSELERQPTTSTLTYPDGFTEYFDSIEEVDEFINSGEILKYNGIQTYSVPVMTAVTLKVYEHADYKGKSLTYNGPIEVPNMKNAYNVTGPVIATNFDNIISSFQLIGNRVQYSEGLPTSSGHFGAMVTFYKDANYKSSSKSFVVDVNNLQASNKNFKKIKFNDAVSSIKLHWVH